MSKAERSNSFLSEDEHNDMQIQGIEVCKCKLERSEEKGLSADKEEVIARLKERSMFQISLSLSHYATVILRLQKFIVLTLINEVLINY